MLELWMVYLILAIVALIIEIFAPSVFCINFTLAGIITAIISIFWGNLATTMIIFIVLSLLSIIFLRPILMKYVHKGEKEDFNADDFSAKYLNKVVKVIEAVSTTKGAITIYDERWEARIKEGEEIPAGSDVKTVSNDGLTIYVERI